MSLSQPLRLFAWALLLAIAPNAAGQGAVLVTDLGDPGAFQTLQSAIDAANDGDVILLRGIGSTEFVLAGKSLVIQGDVSGPFGPQVGGGGTSNIMGPDSLHSVVRDLAPGQTVVLRGLRLHGLELLNVQGQVWIEDCTLQTTAPALRASQTAKLVIENSAIAGPDTYVDDLAYQPPVFGGRGVELTDTDAAFHGVTVSGGKGLDYHCDIFSACWNDPGWDALQISGGSLTVDSGTFSGGFGGAGGDFAGWCSPGLPGGHGISVSGGTPLITLANTSLSGAPGGAGLGQGNCSGGDGGDGADGQPIALGAGTLITSSTSGGGLSADSPIREGASIQISLTGQGNASLAMVLAPTPDLYNLAVVNGPMLVAPSFIPFFLGNLPASGQLQLTLPIPELGPGLDSITLVAQALHKPAGGAWQAGSASAIVLLDGGL